MSTMNIRRRIRLAWGIVAPNIHQTPAEQANEIAAGRMEPREGGLRRKAQLVAEASMRAMGWSP